MAGRASTPPQTSHSGSLPNPPLTPQQVRQTEEARLKAKARRNVTPALIGDGVPSSSTSTVAGQKRPHSSLASAIPSSNRDGSNKALAGTASDYIRPAKNFENFVEYDFSRMQDTKGGFLSIDDDPFNKALYSGIKEADRKPEHMSVAEWEKRQALTKMRKTRQGLFEPCLNVLDREEEERVKRGGREVWEKMKRCRECGAHEIDWQWEEVFRCSVCNACKEKLPDVYSLLTKTEAREDYLLTDPELKDENLLPRLTKPNPHKSTWNDMQLFLRYQVEAYAFSDRKWGSPDALDAEFERRQAQSKARREKKFVKKLAELRKRTRAEADKRGRIMSSSDNANFGDDLGSRRRLGQMQKHDHVWGRPVTDQGTGEMKRKCVECGMEVEELEF